MTNLSFDDKIKRYAELLVNVGLNTPPGKRVMIVASMENDDVVRKLVHHAVAAAYDRGAPFVKVMWRDQHLTKIRLEHAPDDSFEQYDEWYLQARKDITEEGGGMLFLIGDDPDLLAGQDQDKLQTMARSAGKAFRPISKLSDAGYGMWSIGAVAVQAWADKMLPDVPEDQRVMQLWEYIFDACRINTDDPVAAWRDHAKGLQDRAKYLTEKAYKVLHFSAPGTDLTIGLVDGHIWLGGGDVNNQDIMYLPNIPTEEVFTMPHRGNVNGTVKASKPLSYSGVLIDNFSVTFKDGKVVDFEAEQGADALERLIGIDEGSSRLGEVALAPNSSPIAKSGRLFYETLFDENAANHIALGNAYRNTLAGGPELSDEDFEKAGGNDSATHVDFMIGSGEMDVDGIRADGTREAIMRGGEWAFDPNA